MRRWAWICLGLAFVCATLALAPVLLRSGWPANHDLLAPVDRMAAVLGQWKAGNPLPIWSTQQQFGYGSPLPVLYHKSTMYLSAAVLGLTGSVKSALVVPLFIFMVGGFCGMCFCLRHALGGRHPWLWPVGGAALLFSNYLTVDWVVRGALAEASAMLLIPWIVAWCLILLRQGRWARWIGPVLALLVLSHTTLALFALIPLLIAFGMAVARWKRHATSWTGNAVWSAVASTLLLAPFLLPMAAMSRFNRIDRLILSPDFTPRTNQWDWHRFFWDRHWEWGRGWDGLTIQVDLIALLLLPVAVVFALRPRRAATGGEERWPGRLTIAFLLSSLAVFAWLQTSSAFWVYERVPGAQYLQFAWRLLAFVTVMLIVCACMALAGIAQSSQSSRRATMVAACIAVLMVGWAAYPKMWWKFKSYDWYTNAQFRQELASADYAAFGEFLPLTDWPAARGVLDAAPEAKTRLAELVAAHRCHLEPSDGLVPPGEHRSARWQASCAEPSPVAFHVFLAPGMDAQSRPDESSPWAALEMRRSCDDPRVSVLLPAGRSEVRIRFPDWHRTVAALLSRQSFDFRRDCAGAASPAPQPG